VTSGFGATSNDKVGSGVVTPPATLVATAAMAAMVTTNSPIFPNRLVRKVSPLHETVGNHQHLRCRRRSSLAPSPVLVNPTQALILGLLRSGPRDTGLAPARLLSSGPERSCSITVYYKSGPSHAQGLYPKCPVGGRVSWTWKVGTRTTPGGWAIVVSCGSAGTLRTSFITQSLRGCTVLTASA